MKSAIFFLLVVVAMAMAAPQLLTTGCVGIGCLTGVTGLTGITGLTGYPGIVNTIPRTLVAGPTVVNGLGGRYITPGVIAPIY